ncbi:hypothetical protein [Piscirickettsia salmonis]|uniref:hypothetical protein n=1 Tax=Piscirickettsia salmonis TaxID=1238 RepID=UPI003EB6B4C7
MTKQVTLVFDLDDTLVGNPLTRKVEGYTLPETPTTIKFPASSSLRKHQLTILNKEKMNALLHRFFDNPELDVKFAFVTAGPIKRDMVRGIFKTDFDIDLPHGFCFYKSASLGNKNIQLEKIARRTRTKKEDVILVDDNQWNVDSARKAGFQAIKVNSTQEKQREDGSVSSYGSYVSNSSTSGLGEPLAPASNPEDSRSYLEHLEELANHLEKSAQAEAQEPGTTQTSPTTNLTLVEEQPAEPFAPSDQPFEPLKRHLVINNKLLQALLNSAQNKANGIWCGKTLKFDGKKYTKLPEHLYTTVESLTKDEYKMNMDPESFLGNLKEELIKHDLTEVGFWSEQYGGRSHNFYSSEGLIFLNNQLQQHDHDDTVANSRDMFVSDIG